MNNDSIAMISNQDLATPMEVQGDLFEPLNKKGLQFIHINARSMFYKLPQIEFIAFKYNPAVISITETWLDESYTSSSIQIAGYNLLRRDRITHGGGVCMYIKNTLSYDVRQDLQSEHFEDLWVEILLPHTKPILVGTCYRAPKNKNGIDCIEESINKMPIDSDTIILGYFNYCLLKSKTNFTQLLNSHGYSQLIKCPTRVTSNSELLRDHIYVNNENKISQSGVIKTGLSDHFITFCTRKSSSRVN